MPSALRRRLEERRLRVSGEFSDHRLGDYQHLARQPGNPVQRFWHARKWALLSEQLDPCPGDRALDVGAGSSDVSLELSGRCALTCALDASPAPLHFMRDLAGAEARLCFVGGDIHALPFRDGSFDKIAVLEVVEHRAIMAHQEQRRAVLPARATQERERLAGAPSIEVAGGLVGQHQLRLVGQRTRHRHPLLLPDGELSRSVVEAIAEPELTREPAPTTKI